MNKLNKNILRYAMKNKFSLGGLFVLFSICMSSLLTLGMLSNNFSGNYNNVVKNGNQHNIVINETYLSSTDGDRNRKELLDKLESDEAKKEYINARRFEGLTIQVTPESKSKVIKYEPNYPIQKFNANDNRNVETVSSNTIPTDNLQVFIQTGLPYLEAKYLDKVQNFYYLPKSIDFEGIINYVQSNYSEDLTGPISKLSAEQKRILQARQSIVYFLAKGENTDKKYQNLLETIVSSSENTDVSKVDPKVASATETIFKQFFDVNNDYYNFPLIIGSTINFQSFNPLNPKVIKFEDYNSRICIAPPSLLRHQNKEVFSYTKFKNDVNKSENSATTSIFNKDSLNLTEFNDYFNSIPNKYKVKIDNLDYLIVGAGITPDFFYPIVSLENTVVDFNHEAILYTNNNGYARTLNAFQSAPLESLILIKYSGKTNLNIVINKLNELAEKYLAFPAGTRNTYAANDTSNTFSPTAARVQFIEQLVSIVNALAAITSVVLTLITLFIVIIILNKFIAENKKSLYILIAQGVSKSKAALSIILLPLFPCLLAAIFSYLFAYFMQSNVFGIFLAYWPLSVYTSSFNIFILFGVFLGFYGLTSIVSYLITLRNLKGTVSSGISINPAKLGPLAIAAKKPFSKFSVLTRFRVSLAFGSFTKLLFLVVSVFLFTITLSFISSTITTFETSLRTVLDTNKSTMQINLVSPTRNGGQYYGVDFNDMGKTLKDPNNGIVLNPPSFANSNSGYGKYYSDAINDVGNVPLFDEWADYMWISMKDAERQKQELRYMSNVVSWEFLMNIGIALGNNPWTNIAAPLLPSNQRNAADKFTQDLYVKLLSDNRIIKTSSTGIPKNAFGSIYKTKINKFYLVDNSYSDNYVKLDSYIYPVIKVDSDLSKINSEDQINGILLNYGDVFDSTIIVQNFELDISKPNILEITLNKSVDILTSRHLFETFFAATSSSSNMTIFDSIENKDRNFSNNNTGGRIFNVLSLTITVPFINYVIYILSTPDYQEYIYKNIYNAATVNKDDEVYTYVDASFINPYTGESFDKFNTKYQYQNSINIIGIQQNSKFINLVNENNESINDKLFNKSTTFVEGKEEFFPLIPNLYAKKLYNLNIGDKIVVFANNNVDRYNPNLVKNDKDNVNNHYDEYINAYTRTYEIIDFTNSTKDLEFYTTMSAAQKTIGLSYIDDNNNQVLPNNLNVDIAELYPDLSTNFSLINNYNVHGGFNGVFVDNDLIGLSNVISLYSPSGLYPGTPELSPDIEITKTLIENNLVGNQANEENWNILASALYLTDSETKEFINYNTSIKNGTPQNKNTYVDQIINLLSSIYRKTVFFATIDTPSSVQASISTFLNLTNLINTVEIVIVGLVSFLSLIVLVVTAWIIIKDLTQLVVLLKVLGLSDWNNSLNIFAIFIPTWIISGMITLPILYGALELFKEVVFVSMGLIISPTIAWLSFFIIFILVGGFLALLLWLANRYIKKINLIESLKW